MTAMIYWLHILVIDHYGIWDVSIPLILTFQLYGLLFSTLAQRKQINASHPHKHVDTQKWQHSS